MQQSDADLLQWLFPINTNPYKVGAKVVVHPNREDSKLPIAKAFNGKVCKLAAVYNKKLLVELDHSVWDPFTKKPVRLAWFSTDSVTVV